MAEIHVEKKKRPVWPWILAILLAAAVIWIIADDKDNEIENEISTVQSEEQDQMNRQDQDRYKETEQNAATAYVNFIEESGDKVTKSHEYSHQALTHLSNALDEIAQNNNVSLENKKDLDKLKQQADKLMKEKSSTQHANILADAFQSAAQIINNIQKEQFPDLKKQADEVTDAANKMKPNVVVTNQKDAVKGFFEKSANTVDKMQKGQNQEVSLK